MYAKFDRYALNSSVSILFVYTNKEDHGILLLPLLNTLPEDYQNLIISPLPVKPGGLIESTTTLYRDREIHRSVKDLQSTTRLAESWKLHIFDTRVDFPVPVQSDG